MSQPKIGSSLDDFLAGQGILGDVQGQAITAAISWHVGEVMKERKLSRRRLAAMMAAGRPQVDRLLYFATAL